MLGDRNQSLGQPPEMLEPWTHTPVFTFPEGEAAKLYWPLCAVPQVLGVAGSMLLLGSFFVFSNPQTFKVCWVLSAP